uniref:non-specific serine/threonine protein kinase n=1 Tax=Zooxanthella nutricula TaxID=1333877 RepID=A0A7S2VRZ4_9DINO
MVDGLQRLFAKHGLSWQCDRVVHLARQMTAAVQYLHQCNIVHRDVKTDNFMVDRKDVLDPSCCVALGDFGSATRFDLGGKDRLSGAVGTQLFWSPELFNQDYNEKVDTWALGVVMFAVLTHQFPFTSETDVRIRGPYYPKQWSPACKDFVKRMLRKREARRWSADQLASHAFLRGEIYHRARADNNCVGVCADSECVSGAVCRFDSSASSPCRSQSDGWIDTAGSPAGSHQHFARAAAWDSSECGAPVPSCAAGSWASSVASTAQGSDSSASDSDGMFSL